MLITQKYRWAGALLALALTLVACAGTTAPATVVPLVATRSPVSTLTARATPGGEAAGEAAGGEAALVTYTDAAQHFALGHPGPWTQDTTVASGLKFDGGDDSLRLTLTPLPAGTTPLAYAQQDQAAVATAYPGFKAVGLAASTEVPGAVVLGFEAQGTSAVTGKAYAARGDRYYIPLADGRLGVLTVIGPAAHYDREGVRDMALTLKVVR
ncbi:MAG: hypothetical protein M3Z04_20950 [Chloroflexota bacterium]|nr:hypothetical protein [Chloroflexota bacterium]